MKTAVLALSVSLLAASAAYADPVCKTLDDCLALQSKVEARIKELSSTSGTGDLMDIAKDGGGNIIHMNQIDADKYCQSQGTRLPTARELALSATQYGAKVSDTPQNGFDEIDGSDSTGKPDKFYYQYSGYKAPQGDLGSHWFWSSSVVPGDSNYAFVLGGGNGYVDTYVTRSDLYDFNAVRCVRSRWRGKLI